MLLLASALLVAAQDAQRDASRDEPRLARIESNVAYPLTLVGQELEPRPLAARMEALGVPGVSVALIEDGEVAWARGWGLADVDSGRPVTPDTLFQAASISKPIAAVGALSLVDEGVLTLDGSVDEQLTSLQIGDEEHVVTLRGLLTHTAGLTVHGFPGYAEGAALPTTLEVLKGEGNTPPVTTDLDPGSEWRYSGGGYTVMQLLVEDVTGEPFAAVMEQRVLEPLGMTSSTYAQPLPEELRGAAATAYDGRGNAVPGRFHTYPEQAAAGLWTTPSDLARYLIAAQEVLAGEPHPVLEPETARAMLTPGLGDWGLGPSFTEGDTQFGHGGGNMGYRCRMTAFVEGGRGVVIMTNSNNGGALMSELLLTIAREYEWPAPRPTEIEVVALTDAECSAIVGRYTADAGTIEIVYEDDALWAIGSWDEERQRLFPASKERLYTPRARRLSVRYGLDDAPKAVVLSGRRFRREE